MLHPGRSVELVLKALLYAEFSNVLRTPVIGLVFRLCNLGFFALVDPPDVANHMAGQIAIRIVTEQARLDFYARETETLCGKSGHFRVAESVANGHGLKAFGLLQHFLKASAVANRDVHKLR